jgi:hypothetical protein
MPNDYPLGLCLQPITVQIDGVPHEMHYGATEPEYIGAFPIRHEFVVLPPDRDSQDDLSFLGDTPPINNSDFVDHVLQVGVQPSTGQLRLSNSWGQDSVLSTNIGALTIREATETGVISFYSSGGVEVLRITETGDFIIKGRLVQRDLEIYNAFREFIGLSRGVTLNPIPRDEIPTRYERILKKLTEDQ